MIPVAASAIKRSAAKQRRGGSAGGGGDNHYSGQAKQWTPDYAAAVENANRVRADPTSKQEDIEWAEALQASAEARLAPATKLTMSKEEYETQGTSAAPGPVPAGGGQAAGVKAKAAAALQTGKKGGQYRVGPGGKKEYVR